MQLFLSQAILEESLEDANEKFSEENVKGVRALKCYEDTLVN